MFLMICTGVISIILSKSVGNIIDCPERKTNWEEKAKEFNCSRYGPDRFYTCMLTTYGGKAEMCSTPVLTIGSCPILDMAIIQVRTWHTGYNKTYISLQLYRYPECFRYSNYLRAVAKAFDAVERSSREGFIIGKTLLTTPFYFSKQEDKITSDEAIVQFHKKIHADPPPTLLASVRNPTSPKTSLLDLTTGKTVSLSPLSVASSTEKVLLIVVGCIVPAAGLVIAYMVKLLVTYRRKMLRMTYQQSRDVSVRVDHLYGDLNQYAEIEEADISGRNAETPS